MTSLFHRLVIISLFMLLSGSLLAQAQVDPDLPDYEKTSGVSGNLSSVGSDTLANLMTLWAEEFKRVYPNVNVQIQAAGSSTAPPALTEGTSNLGPMSRMMKDNEVQAFEQRNGYKPTSYLHVHGEFLVHGGDWVWVNLGGKHRLNALVAMGSQEVIVSAKRKYGPEFVRREEAELWPNVQNGWFTREEALRLFDRIMQG